MAPGRAARHTRISGTLNRTAGSRAALRTVGWIVLCLLVSMPIPSGTTRAGILALRPGPIELPHFVAAADFDRDGYQDLVVANFQAGTLDILINQKDGTFAPQEFSPVDIGIASFNNPTPGPLIVRVADLNPDDVDSDNIANPFDNCPNVANASQSLSAEGFDGYCGARGPDNVCGTLDDDDNLFGADAVCGTIDDLPGADDNPSLNGPDGICGTADDETDSTGPGNACRILEDTTGDGIPDSPVDSDGDGVLDFDPATDMLDNCPLTPNPGQEDDETAEGPDTICNTADDNPLLYGPDGQCGTADDLGPGDKVGDACPVSPDLVILENSVGLGSPLGIMRVRVNTGSGRMSSRTSKLLGLQPASLVLEDFDGDGLPDAVVSSGDSDALQLFPGGAEAQFQDQVILDTGDYPQGLATGDFDGDGDADLAVAQSCDHTLGLYRNDNGVMPATQTVFVTTDAPPLSIQPSLLVAGSFNDDDLDDVAVLGFEGGKVCTDPGGDPFGDLVYRQGLCCTKDADCDDPDDDSDDPKCLAGGQSQGTVQIFLGAKLCAGGPNDGNPCADDTECADSPPDPATDGTCDIGLVENPTAGFTLGVGERSTGGILWDFDADGACGGMEPGSCDSGGNNTCTNSGALGEPCTADADCDRSICDVGPFIGKVCQMNRDCSAGDLALSIGRAAGGNGRVSIYAGLGDGSVSPMPTNITGFMLPQSLTPIDLDPAAGTQSDLAVLDRDVQRTILFDNDDIPGSASFTVTPESPASAWKLSSAMKLQAIDLSLGIDLVLLQETPVSIAALSGIGNGFFRSLMSLPIEGTIDGAAALTSGSDLLPADLRDDDRIDLVVLDSSDPATGYMTVVLNTVFGQLEETDTYTVPGGFASASTGSLITEITDYDRDGIPNLLDNCPTRYNPPLCDVDDPACPADIVCGDATLSPTDCMTTDPTTMQCDSDGNGIGDHCQILDLTCTAVDSDFDFVVDYNPNALGMTSTGEPDFDRDGVANAADNCPTFANADQLDDNDNGVGNPPGNFIGDACEVPLELKTGTCMNIDTNTGIGECTEPAAMSCMIDGDCVTTECTGDSDADMDGVCDYDPRNLPQPDADAAIAVALDNCLGTYNPRRCSDDLTVICNDDSDCGAGATCAQPDTDNDRVGNACVIEAGLDNCPFFINTDQADSDADGVGDGCALPVADVLAVDPSGGTITPFTGDGSGGLFAGTLPPFTGLSTPSSALVGPFSLRCIDLFNTICFATTGTDLVVAEIGTVGDPNDDRITILHSDGSGNFAPGSVPAPTQGDPERLQADGDQPVCPSPHDPARPLLRFDTDATSNVIVTPQPGTSTIGIFIPSNQAQIGMCIGGLFDGNDCSEDIDCEDPGDPTNNGTCSAGSEPSLVAPPGYPAPLPVPVPLAAVELADMNNDGIRDIVALSSGDGDPATPNLTLYFGIGNGLYFTDPSLNPIGVPDGATLLSTGNINLMTDFFLPEVTLFYPPEDRNGNGILESVEDLNGNGVLDGDRGPIVLTNILNERSDVDGSGRIDGFDMAVLSRSFGAVRGEDFSLVVGTDGLVQFAQTGTGTCALGANAGNPCLSDRDCPGGTCGQLFRRVLDNSNGSIVGTDLPDNDGICNQALDPMTAARCDTSTGTCSAPGSKVGEACATDSDCGDVLYGLSVDINLDGIVDGLDLAIMASLFGQTL